MSHRSGHRGSTAACRIALAEARRTALDLADDLLTHLPDLGDGPTQRSVDAWVEQAADTLRAVAEALEERLFDTGPGPPTAYHDVRRGIS